jgi:enediyne biosynthesis protein CalE5
VALQQGRDAQAVRTHVHGIWSAVAPQWQEHAEFVDRRLEHVTAAMLERTDPRAGERVLELACGPGGAGLAAATRVGEGGEVVLSDVVVEMTEIAAARAVARKLGWVRTAVLDLEAIDMPDDVFDVVLCREGLMFALEPERAAREIRRVLGENGRAAISVWGERAANPWLGIVLDAVSEQIGAPVPPPGVPGPFSLDDPARLEALLSGAGFADVVVEAIPAPLCADSFDAWWARTLGVAGPLAAILDGMPDRSKHQLTERVRDAVTPYVTTAGLELPGLVLLASAHA